MPRPSFCTDCPISGVTTGYTSLQLGKGKSLLVGENSLENDQPGKPFSGPAGSWLNNILFSAGIHRSDLNVINTIGCQPPQNIYPLDEKWNATPKADARYAVEHCGKYHLWPAIQQLKPDKIFAVGEQALKALTDRSGILVWRGSALPLKGDNSCLKVIPTLHPSYLARDAKMVSVSVNDYRKRLTPVPEHYNLYATRQDLEKIKYPKVVSFDFEWDYKGNITLCGVTTHNYHCLTAGWGSATIPEFKRIFEASTDLIGHNLIGAEMPYLEKWEWKIGARIHDTMLKQHLVQPDYRHGLGFVASVFTNKMFWKGKGEEQEDADGNIIEIKAQWKTWNTPQAIPRELGGYGGCVSDDEAYRLYNARDTDGAFQINQQLDLLLKKYDLEKVYWNVSLPIAYIARDISNHGIEIDNSKVSSIREELGIEIDKLELTLPPGLAPITESITRQVPAPPGTFKAKVKICKGTRKLPHDPVTLTFLSPTGDLQCSGCGKVVNPGKLSELKKIKVPATKVVRPWNSSQKVMAYARAAGLKIYMNRKRGTAAADVNARKGWGRTNPEFRILDRLKDLNTERNNFAKEGMKNVHRLFFNLLVHGTSEGRFSSSGKRPGIDPNIQNQPKSIRKIYIPDHSTWSFVELDYASGENMLTAHIAQDFKRLERLKQPGYSEHLELAKFLFNLPSTVSKKEASNWEGQDLYGIGKVINHGSNYGMTYVKLKEEMESNGFFYTDADCKRFIAAGKDLNPETARWQAETIERAKRDGCLTNPFGRKRWFSTRDVATKSLAFLPASTLADIIIRAMIAHYPERFPEEISNLRLERVGEFLPEWIISIQVHDSLVLQGPHEFQIDQAIRTAAIMTQPWRELDGFSLGVEVKAGQAGGDWGSLKVITL